MIKRVRSQVQASKMGFLKRIENVLQMDKICKKKCENLKNPAPIHLYRDVSSMLV